MRSPDFPEAFEALTGHRPFPWQARLFDMLRRGEIPSFCDLPTGLGKTAVIPVWIAALAFSAGERPLRLPRRLAYVVNRRTVVDQATDVTAQIRERLLDPGNQEWGAHADTLRWIAERLGGLAAFGGEPLAVSTLRGELADNGEWKADPARPAVIIGTIDMIGSRLLFSGYGDGQYHRPHHAGLLGQDTLVVHDETHLVPAFDELLRVIEDCQRRDGDPRPMRVLSMSATPRHGSTHGAITLDKNDEQDPEVQKRIRASKTLCLHQVDTKKDIVRKIAELALCHEAKKAKVLVYITSPRDALEVKKIIAGNLGKRSADRVALLTGTIRGFERDRLVRSDKVYRAMLGREGPPEATVYLVSTSAGEVGNDFDADHMVCDGTSLDSLVQRLGRVNRRGGRESRVDVVYAVETDTEDDPVLATIRFLEERGASLAPGIDASPAAMRQLVGDMPDDQKQRCFRRPARSIHATDVRFDLWALTSVPGDIPGRLDVSVFLHGIERDPPDTAVAWRLEVTLLDRADVDGDALERWFRLCRIHAREWLRDSTSEVASALKKLVESRKPDSRVVVLDGRGGARWADLSKLADDPPSLRYKTVVLPVEAGGLDEHGMMDPGHADPAHDVADDGSARERWLRATLDGEERYLRLTSELCGQLVGCAANTQDMASWVFEHDSAVPELDSKKRVLATVALVEPPEDGGGASLDLIASTEAPQNADADPETLSVGKVALADHARAVTLCAARIADALGLCQEQKQALVLAAEHHDDGKAAPIWQWYARSDPKDPVAKSPRYLHPRALAGYRHEAGSLVDCLAPRDGHHVELPDLTLHLIAAHHGWARPHFSQNACTSVTRVPSTWLRKTFDEEVPRRFGRMQAQFGRWGLAWLESLLRCADLRASSDPIAAPSIPWIPYTVHSVGRMSTVHGFAVSVSVLNPGQFLACCGLLELAHRLRPGVEGYFSNDDSEFVIEHDQDAPRLEDLVGHLKESKAEDIGGGLLRIPDPFNLILDWWLMGDGSGARKTTALKTWAGRQRPTSIMPALQHALGGWDCKSELLDYECVVQKPSGKSRDKVEPFYFDSRRFTDGLGEGYSLDEVGMEAKAHPAVELLAFIGLQRFRPAHVGDPHSSTFRYWTWRTPLPVSVACAAASGIIRVGAAYEFDARPRDGKNRYKGFVTARRVQEVRHG